MKISGEDGYVNTQSLNDNHGIPMAIRNNNHGSTLIQLWCFAI
ncbi:hypothetical protein Hanom_Chr11g00996211 [Helianthus anomalus]